MFGFFKKKPTVVVAPISGELVKLEDVKDEVFSQKLAGDGVAIIPSSGEIVAPIDGVITRLFPTRHAFLITTKDNLEVMVHIGLDTVELKGEGFKVLKQEGDKVVVNTPIITVDLDYLKSKGKDIVTPIVIDGKSIYNIKLGLVKSGEPIFEVK